LCRRIVVEGDRVTMEMKKDVHLSAQELLEMVQMKPGAIGDYTIIPGPRERLEAVIAKLENPAKDFSYMEHTMYTGSHQETKVTAVNGGLYSPHTGSCGALSEDISIGDLIIVSGAVRGEGTTPYYVPSNFSTVSDVRVTSALMNAAEMLGVKCHVGVVWTTDALLKETKELVEEMRRLQVKAVDMVSSSLLTVAQLYGVKAGTILAVSDNLITGELGFMDPKYYETEEAMIDIALKAVTIMEDR
jgi:uridine phosphorylase